MHIKLNKTFFKILAAFLTIIFLSMISYLFFYLSAYHIIRDNIINDGYKELSMFDNEMERNVYEAYSFIYKTGNDPTIEAIDNKHSANYYDYLRITEYIKQTLAMYPFISDIVFYDKNSSLTISRQGVFSVSELFSEYFYNENRNVYFWKDYLEKPNQPNMFPRHEIFAQETYLNKSIFKEESLKSELIVLAAEYNTFKNFRLLIFLNAKTIGNVFGDNTLVIRDDGRTLLLSNTAIPVNINLIFDVINKSDSGLGSIEDRESDSYVFYNKSKNYNWYYVKIISYKKAFSSINAFSNLALLVIISLFFSSFFLSYYFSLKMYKPIRRLTDLIENPSTEMYGDALGNANNRKPDEIQQIYQYLMNININYESIEKRFAIMQDVFKELFYVKLIKEPEIDEGIIKELNLDPADFDNIAVISYTLNFKPEFYKFEQNNEKLGKINFSIKEMVDFVLKNMNVNSYSFQVNSNSFISILLLSGKNFNVQDFENKVLGILKNDSDILYVNFAVSRVYHGLHELKTAYNEALEYSEYCSIRMESQFATFEKVKNIKIQKIPKKLFTKIRSIIELIEFDNLEASFIELTEYLEEKNVPIIYIKSGLITIVNDLLGKAEIEGVNPEGIESIYKEIEVLRTKERCDEIINKICKLCKAALEQMNENTSGNSIVEDMAAYISKNYSEDISLDLFAEKYRMSPIYLSKLFKDCKGVNYMDYLNDVRMEKAKEFLLNI